MVSLSPICEGQSQTELRLRRFGASSHQTASPSIDVGLGRITLRPNDPNCEGQVKDGFLGWAQKTVNLVRYYGNGYHWVTTGTVPPGYDVEFSLGSLLTIQKVGTHALYGCTTGVGQFLFAFLELRGVHGARA